MEKLGVESRPELVRFAIEHGVVDAEPGPDA
jgi:DNA-binding CsgD family transcriptional regulator